MEGRSYEEIATALGVTDGAVRQLLNRARNTLRAAAASVIPLPLVERVAVVRVERHGRPRRVAELVGVGGSAVAMKVCATALVTGAVLGGAAVVPDIGREQARGAAGADAAHAAEASGGESDAASEDTSEASARGGGQRGEDGGGPRRRRTGAGTAAAPGDATGATATTARAAIAARARAAATAAASPAATTGRPPRRRRGGRPQRPRRGRRRRRRRRWRRRPRPRRARPRRSGRRHSGPGGGGDDPIDEPADGRGAIRRARAGNSGPGGGDSGSGSGDLAEPDDARRKQLRQRLADRDHPVDRHAGSLGELGVDLHHAASGRAGRRAASAA